MSQPVLTEIYANGLDVAPWAPDEAPSATTPHVLRITGVGYANGEEYDTVDTFVLAPEALQGLAEQAIAALAAAGQLDRPRIASAVRMGRTTKGQK